MALDTVLRGSASGAGAEVAGTNQLKVIPETVVHDNPQNVGAVKTYGENDQGQITGELLLSSPEVDVDYRQRISQDLVLDEVVFNYTAQDTGKHLSAATTIASAWTVGNFTTNSGATAAPAANSFAGLATWAQFPSIGTQTLSCDVEAAFSAQPVTNTYIEFGFAGAQYVPSASAPTDGVFLRLNSSGLQGIAANSSTETSTGVFPLSDGAGTWVYQNDKKYQFIIYMGGVEAEFWVNDGDGALLLGRIPLPSGQGRMNSAQGLRFFFNQRVTVGAAGGAIQGRLGAYNVRLGGSNITSTVSAQGSRIWGSYQGASGGTMGTLATYPNSTNPTAAAPSNTALTANLPGGLGGQGTVTAAAGGSTDGIWSSYQVPASTVSIPGRRLVLRGVRLDAVNTGAAVATTATTIQFSLAFGHTAVSLATAEAVAAKAPRRIALGYMTWAVGEAIGAQPQAGPVFLDLGDAPIFVNPGEFVALVGKFIVGTATASQTITFTYTPIYGWE
jgi:hypothetical protein